MEEINKTDIRLISEFDSEFIAGEEENDENEINVDQEYSDSNFQNLIKKKSSLYSIESPVMKYA